VPATNLAKPKPTFEITFVHAILALIGWNLTWLTLLRPVPAPHAHRVGHVISIPSQPPVSAAMKRVSPNWSLILSLYAIAAIVLVLVRDEIGTGNDPYLKIVGWVSLTYAVYWSIRGAFAWVGKPAVSASDTPPTQPARR